MGDDSKTREPGEERGEEEGHEGFARGVSDSLRKVISGTIRSVIPGDEGLRAAIVDAFPKELLGYVMRQVDAGKDEIVRMVGLQIRKFLENLDLGGELQKVLTSLSFEVRTEVRFVPNDQAVRPDARVRVRIRRGDDVEDVTENSPRARALRKGIVRAVDNVLGAFVKGEGVAEGVASVGAARATALREGILAAVEAVIRALPGEDDELQGDGEADAVSPGEAEVDSVSEERPGGDAQDEDAQD